MKPNSSLNSDAGKKEKLSSAETAVSKEPAAESMFGQDLGIHLRSNLEALQRDPPSM